MAPVFLQVTTHLLQAWFIEIGQQILPQINEDIDHECNLHLWHQEPRLQLPFLSRLHHLWWTSWPVEIQNVKKYIWYRNYYIEKLFPKGYILTPLAPKTFFLIDIQNLLRIRIGNSPSTWDIYTCTNNIVQESYLMLPTTLEIKWEIKVKFTALF